MSIHGFVSVVIPVLNEEKYIDRCIDSLFKQDFPQEKMEWLFIDGGSGDRTPEKLEKYAAEHPQLIRVLNNEHRTAPYAMNIGIRASRGEYIVRLDAHSEYASDYISSCIRVLNEAGADNVGGFVETVSSGYIGNAIALVLTSRFGVGNSQFRLNKKGGFVDTVPFGAFRRELFDRIGMYDERLTRIQDYELNHRIRKSGGKIYLSPDIRLKYYCRDSIKGIIKQCFTNGKWNVLVQSICGGSLPLRHFVPLAFVLSIIVFAALIPVTRFMPFAWALAGELALYFTLDLVSSIRQSLKKSIKYAPMMFVLYPIVHISYGIGSLCALFALPSFIRRSTKRGQ